VKFLWQSNAPWAGTGYGQQTKLMLSALKQLGHDPSCFCFYGLAGGKITYDGYECLPNSDYETWGNDVIQLHADRSDSEVIVTLIDLFVLNKEIWGKLNQPWIAWTPIDCEGIGSGTGQLLKAVDYPVAMSHFGAQQMREFGVEPATVIWHAVDTEVFKPGDKAEARELLGLPQDAYIVGMVMANKGDRKQYPIQFQAVKKFKETHPETAIYIHTEPTAAMGGWDMRVLSEISGLKGSVYSTNQYDVSVVPAGQELLAKIYSAFDVLMNCSAGEGFGIPIIEAQACGIPVLTGNWTAMPEITVNGYTVESAGPLLGGHFGWQHHPDIDDMVYKLECAYRMSTSADAERGRLWVEANCALPVIVSQWEDILLKAKEEGKKKYGPPAKLPEGYVTV